MNSSLTNIRRGAARQATLATLACAVILLAPTLGHVQAAGAGDGGVSAFYVWKDAVTAAPGKLLRSEPQEERLALAGASRSVRILYSSTDGPDGHSPIAVSGALYLPKGAPPEGGWPLMGWAHGTVGIADVCAPSWAGRSERDITYLNHRLDQGYAVVASDYQGLGTGGGHPCLIARPEAYSVLDSVRAVEGGDFGLSKKVVIIGQSQGGGAAFAATVFAQNYAPELDIRGTVATGTPNLSPAGFAANAKANAEAADKVSPTFAYVLLILYTIAQTDPSFAIADYDDKAAATTQLAKTACLGAIEKQVIAEGLTFKNSFKKDPTKPLIATAALMAYPTLKTAIPIFMATGGKDLDVPPPGQERLAKDACTAGTRIEWRFYPDFDHSATVNGSLPDSTPFVKRAFAGETIEGNCAATLAGEK
jgi:pimeloyl-ACP methyl ester carboxylesterase